MSNRIKKFSPFLLVLFLAILFLASQPGLYSGIKLRVLDVFHFPLKVIQFPFLELKKIILYRSFSRENSRLRNQVDSLRRRIVNQEEIFQENERLKRLLSFKNKSSFSLIASRVIAREPSNWDSVAVIDKGRNEGVRENMAVITELGLAGQVFEAGRNTSKIILLSDPNFNVAALLQRTREEGMVSGTITGACRMRYLSLNSDVKTGDIVVTSGLAQEFPKGILIGSVVDSEDDSSGLSKNCIIKPAVDLSKLEEVLLVIQ